MPDPLSFNRSEKETIRLVIDITGVGWYVRSVAGMLAEFMRLSPLMAFYEVDVKTKWLKQGSNDDD